jgi:hypothetical protein
MFSTDEVAGVVDLFGALSREEATMALSELAYRRGGDAPEGDVDAALAAFALVAIERDGERVLAPGPAAFPELPEGAEDLPHILEHDGRSVDREALTRAATVRLRTEAVCATTLCATERAAELVDISYDLEAWGSPDLEGIRVLLDAVESRSRDSS